ncbi:MAG: RNA polymerase sigma factor [Candidatus Eisenbacteria bacterium]|nr:RNA polymerase sigma factor [Candidatus Eisenbacteria bacterium]
MTAALQDQELAARARGGSLAAWKEIYETTRPRLFGFLVYQVGNRDESLEILQETYLAAMSGIKGYRGEASLESWLLGIAVRRMKNWSRRCARWRRRFQSAEGFEDVAGGSDPSSGLLGRRLRAALHALTEAQRTALLLHVWFDYSYADIAAVMRIRESTARVHAFRAKELLKRRLGPVPLSGTGLCAQENPS